MNSIFSILLTPFAQKLCLFFHHGCIPDLLLQFRFHFDCQFQAPGAISWEAEAWVSWKQMEWRVWSCRCCFLRWSSMMFHGPCLEPALQALAVKDVKGSVLAESTLSTLQSRLERSPGLMSISLHPSYMLDHVGIWELLFHLENHLVSLYLFSIPFYPPGKRGWGRWGLVCGAPSCSSSAKKSACWDLVGHRQPMSHKLRTNWNSCGCSIGLSGLGSY